MAEVPFAGTVEASSVAEGSIIMALVGRNEAVSEESAIKWEVSEARLS